MISWSPYTTRKRTSHSVAASADMEPPLPMVRSSTWTSAASRPGGVDKLSATLNALLVTLDDGERVFLEGDEGLANLVAPPLLNINGALD